MADLDDFFAKKDRKKKTTKKFSTTDEVAKKLEDTAKKTEKVVKKPSPEGDEANAQNHEQDEWKEFEEEKKDYTGLKIGNLTINPATEQANNETQEERQVREERELTEEIDKKAGPWKRVDADAAPAPEPVKEKKPEPSAAPVRSGAYVPPSMRGGNSNNPPPMSHNARLKMGSSKAAPDVHNEDLFPTLSKTNDHKKHRTEGAFEVVQHTGRSNTGSWSRQEQSRAGPGPKVTLENRYNTLSHDS